jgi:hypothetical protein
MALICMGPASLPFRQGLAAAVGTPSTARLSLSDCGECRWSQERHQALLRVKDFVMRC